MHHELELMGVPLDLGAGRRGVDMGASALRLAQLAPKLSDLGYKVHDNGNITVGIAEKTRPIEESRNKRFADVIVEACKEVYTQSKALDAETIPIFLGGDHSLSLGSVAGVCHHQRVQGKRTGVIWLDAHADLNTPETSPSGNVHGMPLAHLLGLGDAQLKSVWGGGAVVQPEDVVFIGLRDVDNGEKVLIKELGIQAFTMSDIDRHGMAEIAQRTLAHFKGKEFVHLSFDADALDPDIAPGVGTPVPGGLVYREAHLLMEMLAKAQIITSLDVVEVNPILDSYNSTANLMMDMILSLFGKTILG